MPRLTSVLALAAVAGSLALVPGAAQASTGVSVASLVLPASAVGPGYVEKSRKDGVGIAFSTLDLCGFNYYAEKLRTDRRQVNYVKSGSKVDVSNEVVSFKPGGTKETIFELNDVIKKCPKQSTEPAGNGYSVTHYKVTTFRATGLLPNSIAALETIKGAYKGKAFSDTVAEIYQVHGTIFSAIYVQGGAVAAIERQAASASRGVAKEIATA